MIKRVDLMNYILNDKKKFTLLQGYVDVCEQLKLFKLQLILRL